MNNNVKRSNNPFNGPLAAKNTQSNEVGSNYEDRRKFLSTRTVTARPTNAAKDDFTKTDKAKGHMEQFGPNAKYSAGRRLSAEGPYRAPRLNGIETGATPKAAGNAKPPTDASMLRFLDDVISRKELHSGRAIQNKMIEQRRAIQQQRLQERQGGTEKRQTAIEAKGRLTRESLEERQRAIQARAGTLQRTRPQQATQRPVNPHIPVGRSDISKK